MVQEILFQVIFLLTLLRCMSIHQREVLPFSFLPPFYVGINSQQKEFALLGENSFL